MGIKVDGRTDQALTCGVEVKHQRSVTYPFLTNLPIFVIFFLYQKYDIIQLKIPPVKTLWAVYETSSLLSANN